MIQLRDLLLKASFFLQSFLGRLSECMRTPLLKRRYYFNNGLVTGVASSSFCTIVQLLQRNNFLLTAIPCMAI